MAVCASLVRFRRGRAAHPVVALRSVEKLPAIFRPGFREHRCIKQLPSITISRDRAACSCRVGWETTTDIQPRDAAGARLGADRQLRVKLYIHRGDEATMVAVPMAPAPRASSPTSKRPRRGARRPGR